MVDMAQVDARQAAHEKRYDAKREAQRPKPKREYHELLSLARKAVEGDASAALEFAVDCTPGQFVLAHEAKVWDDSNPLYGCISCRDGKDLPEGYECQVCGADSPSRRY